MKKINIKNIELGNLLFGHPKGMFLIPRNMWENEFINFLLQCGFDERGHMSDLLENKYGKCKLANQPIKLKSGQLYYPHIHYFENDMFLINPYYWGDNEELSQIPNFIYKPLDIAISWYKYPLRNAYITHDITKDEFINILHKCYESLH